MFGPTGRVFLLVSKKCPNWPGYPFGFPLSTQKEHLPPSLNRAPVAEACGGSRKGGSKQRFCWFDVPSVFGGEKSPGVGGLFRLLERRGQPIILWVLPASVEHINLSGCFIGVPLEVGEIEVEEASERNS